VTGSSFWGRSSHGIVVLASGATAMATAHIALRLRLTLRATQSHLAVALGMTGKHGVDSLIMRLAFCAASSVNWV